MGTKTNKKQQQSICNANAMSPWHKEYVREFFKTFLMPTYWQGIQILKNQPAMWANTMLMQCHMGRRIM